MQAVIEPDHPEAEQQSNDDGGRIAVQANGKKEEKRVSNRIHLEPSADVSHWNLADRYRRVPFVARGYALVVE